MKIFTFLFEYLQKISNNLEYYSIFLQISEIFSIIYMKFPDEKDFLPAGLINNLTSCKSLTDISLQRSVITFISLIIFKNPEKNYSELIEINDIMTFPFDVEEDPFVLGAIVNICMKIYKNPSYSEHHTHLLTNILTVYDRILKLEACNKCIPIVHIYI